MKKKLFSLILLAPCAMSSIFGMEELCKKDMLKRNYQCRWLCKMCADCGDYRKINQDILKYAQEKGHQYYIEQFEQQVEQHGDEDNRCRGCCAASCMCLLTIPTFPLGAIFDLLCLPCRAYCGSEE